MQNCVDIHRLPEEFGKGGTVLHARVYVRYSQYSQRVRRLALCVNADDCDEANERRTWDIHLQFRKQKDMLCILHSVLESDDVFLQ